MTRRLRWNERIWKRTQSVVLWLIGASALVNELFIQPKPRPEAWPIIGALLALPFADAYDRTRRARRELRGEDE